MPARQVNLYNVGPEADYQPTKLWRNIAKFAMFLMFLGLSAAALTYGAPVFGLIFIIPFTVAIYHSFKKSRYLNNYMSQQAEPLKALGVYNRFPRLNYVLTVFSLLITGMYLSAAAPGLAIPVLAFATLPVALSGAAKKRPLTPLAMCIALSRAKANSTNNGNIKKFTNVEKGMFITRSLAKLGVAAGIVFAAYTVPIIAMGVLATALGPIGVGIFAGAVLLLAIRFVMNDYIQMRLQQLDDAVKAENIDGLIVRKHAFDHQNNNVNDHKNGNNQQLQQQMPQYQQTQYQEPRIVDNTLAANGSSMYPDMSANNNMVAKPTRTSRDLHNNNNNPYANIIVAPSVADNTTSNNTIKEATYPRISNSRK